MDNASILKLKEQVRLLKLNQCPSVCDKTVVGAICKNLSPVMMASKEARQIEPAPIHGIIFLGSLLPNRNKIKNPISGRAGIHTIELFI